MSARELDILLNETWSAYGKMQREDAQNVSGLAALTERITLLNQSRYGGFEAQTPMARDPDRHGPSVGEPTPSYMDSALHQVWLDWRQAEQEGDHTKAARFKETYEIMAQKRWGG
jgi:hypothetical protein